MPFKMITNRALQNCLTQWVIFQSSEPLPGGGGVTAIYAHSFIFFHFQSFKEGDPSTKVVFQGALHLKIQ